MLPKPYRGLVPPCGVFCGTCPRYVSRKNPCPGASQRCTERKCKTFHACCVQDRHLSHCGECPKFPCYKFRKFAVSWLALGQDLVQNQLDLKKLGTEKWLDEKNDSTEPLPTPDGKD